jgi:uncharacterized protein
MSIATMLSFLGVFAVLVVAFGGFRHSVMAMTALMVGTVWTCGCVTLLVGHVTILSIAFGSILFGLGIDYGILYAARYLQFRGMTSSTSEALVATASSIGPGITAGAITSALSFFAAGLTNFPGVAQLGIIAGSGLLLCWLAQMTVLPAMIRMCDPDGTARKFADPLDMRRFLKPLYAKPGLVLGLVAAGTLAIVGGVRSLWYDYNLLHMQPKGLECVELEHKLFNQTNTSSWFALSIAKTRDEAIARKEAFLKLSSVDRVEEIASKLPAESEQKRPLVERIHGRLTNLPLRAPPIPVVPPGELDRMLSGVQTLFTSTPNAAQAVEGLQRLRGLLRSMPPEEANRRIATYQQTMATDLLARLKALQGASVPLPPALADLPEGVIARSVGKTGCYLMRIYSKADIWNVTAMDEFVRQVRSIDPEVTGNPLQVYEASHEIKQSYKDAAGYALLAIIPFVWFDFRRISYTLLAALPMGIALLQTFALMGLLNIPLNQANMIVLPFFIGIGMESGINLVNDLRCQTGRYRGATNSVLLGVLLNTLTTMVGFGALMIANHQGLQSLGRVLTISMGCCLLCSLVLPNLLMWLLGSLPGSAEDEPIATATPDEPESTLDRDVRVPAPHFRLNPARKTPAGVHYPGSGPTRLGDDQKQRAFRS